MIDGEAFIDVTCEITNVSCHVSIDDRQVCKLQHLISNTDNMLH